MNDLFFRNATSTDIPFLLSAVKAAERLGATSNTYQKLFQLSASEVDTLLSQAFSIESNGYQLSLSTFFVCTQGNVPVACCSTWIEAADGVPSGFKMATVLSQLLGLEKWIDAKAAIKAFADAMPHRNAGTLQMETFYVEPRCRGQGLTGRIIDSVTRLYDFAVDSPKFAEISLLEGNTQALHAYQKAGFHFHVKGNRGNALFQTLTGNTGFIQLRKMNGA